MLVSGLSVAVGVVAWALASRALDSQLFPSPKAILDAALDMTRNGTLFADIAVSLRRIGIGFALGCLVGIPLGLAMGLFRFARARFDPIVQFLRFVPPIAWLIPAIMWFGIGETSKVLIIFYMTVFLVLLNTMAGVSVAFQSVAHGAKLRRDALAAVRVGRAPRNDGCRPHGPRGDESLPAPLPAGRPSWPLKRRRPSIPRPTAPGASQCAMSSSATPARSSRSCAT